MTRSPAAFLLVLCLTLANADAGAQPPAGDQAPPKPSTMIDSGVIHLEQGRLRDAFAAFQAARVQQPFNPRIYLRLAQVYYKAELREREQDALRTAIRLQPDLVTAHRHLAHALAAEGAYYAASAEFAWLLDHAERNQEPVDPTVIHDFARVYELLGDKEEAARLRERHLLPEPDTETTAATRGQVEPLRSPTP